MNERDREKLAKFTYSGPSTLVEVPGRDQYGVEILRKIIISPMNSEDLEAVPYDTKLIVPICALVHQDPVCRGRRSFTYAYVGSNNKFDLGLRSRVPVVRDGEKVGFDWDQHAWVSATGWLIAVERVEALNGKSTFPGLVRWLTKTKRLSAHDISLPFLHLLHGREEWWTMRTVHELTIVNG